MSKKIFRIFKISISLFLLGFIISKIDWSQTLISLKLSNKLLLLLSILVSYIGVAVMSYKWNILLRIKGYIISTFNLSKITLISGFLGMFLPSSLSTDIVRGYYLTKEKSSKVLSASTIIIDRISGIASMLFIGLIGVYSAEKLFQDYEYRPILIGLFLILVLFVLIFLNKGISVRILQKAENNFILRKISKIYEVIIEYKKEPKVLFNSFALSVFAQIIRAFKFFIIALSINIEISFAYFIIIVPLVMIAVMIPISIGGIGVKEGIMVSFFHLIGIPLNDSITLALLETTTNTIVILSGGLLYLFYKPSISKLN